MKTTQQMAAEKKFFSANFTAASCFLVQCWFVKHWHKK
jgi:hypothetical protein